jgi:hypothetical protein
LESHGGRITPLHRAARLEPAAGGRGHRGAIEIIKLAWTSETFAYDGHFIWLDQGLSVHERAMEKLERLAAQLMPGPK